MLRSFTEKAYIEYHRLKRQVLPTYIHFTLSTPHAILMDDFPPEDKHRWIPVSINLLPARHEQLHIVYRQASIDCNGETEQLYRPRLF
jgi:hypothetical protein